MTDNDEATVHQGGSGLLTTAQVAQSLGVSRQWVNALVRQGKLHPAESPGSGGRTIAHLFYSAEVEHFQRVLREANVDWPAISSALDVWEVAKNARDEQLAHIGHLEASMHMAKGNLALLLDPPAMLQLSELLQSNDPAGIRELLTRELLEREPLKRPRQLWGGELRHSWAMILREMYLRAEQALSPLTLAELEPLAIEGSLEDALRQLETRQLISWLGEPHPPQLTERGRERAENMRYTVIRRIETPNRRMDWFDWKPSLKEAQQLRDESARRYPDAKHIIKIAEGDWGG